MKDVIILGGGISGIVCGITLKRLGYNTIILEKNYTAGGLCATYNKASSQLDLCIHYVLGSGNEKIKKLYKEYGFFSDTNIIHLPYFYKFYYKDMTLTVSKDINEFRSNLLSVSKKEDEKEINTFIKYIKKFAYFPMVPKKSMDIMNQFEKLRTGMSYLKYIKTYSKLSRMTIKEYSNLFKTDIIKEFILSFMPSHFSITYLIAILAKFMTSNANMLNISSKRFFNNALKIYLDLGGIIKYDEEVISLHYKDNNISAIKTKNNIYKDFSNVICAMPLNHFYNNILDKKYYNNEIYTKINDVENNKIISTFQVFFKVTGEIHHNIPHYFIVHNKDNIKVASSINPSIGFKSYAYLNNIDNSLTISAIVDQDENDYKIWKEKYDNLTYYDYKKECANKIKDMLLVIMPFLSDNIKIVDIITPLSIEKWDNALYGGYLSNMATKTSNRGMFKVKDINLGNLYYAGQMVSVVGGIPSAIFNGKSSAMVLDYYERKNKNGKKRNL